MAYTIVKWNVDTDGDWSNASNWSTGTLPNSGDNVVISTAHVHTISHSGGGDVVHQLTVGSKDLFVLSGGSLDILSSASFAGGFTQTGGVLEAGSVDITGPGTLTGGEAIGATVFTISETVALANYTLAGSTVLNNSSTTNQTGGITLGDNTGVNATINNQTGATYDVAGDFGIAAGASSAIFVNSGTLEKGSGSGTSSIGVNVTSTGSIVAVSGDLNFAGATNSIGGTIGGGGEVSFAGGVTQLTATAVTSAELGLYNNATLNLGANLSYAGILDDRSNGNNALNLGTHSLTLGTGSTANFQGNFGTALITGSGTLTNQGTMNLLAGNGGNALVFGGTLTLTNTHIIQETGNVTFGDGSGATPTIVNKGTYDFTTDSSIGENGTLGVLANTGTLSIGSGNGGSAFVLDGTTKLDNTGTIDQSGNVTIGGSGGEVASIVNEANGTYNLGAALGIGNGTAAASHFDNSGSFDVSSGTGTATITTTFNNLAGGTIDITAGILQNNDILVNNATISGTRLVDNASMTLNAGTDLSVGEIDIYNSATLNLGTNVSYGQTFADSTNGSTTINLAGHTLTLTGPSLFAAYFGDDYIEGPGTLKIAHAAQIEYGAGGGGIMVVGGTATLEIAAAVTVTGNIQIGDASSNPSSMVIDSAGTYDFTADFGIGRGASVASLITNNGLFEKTAGTGTSVVSCDFVNNGTITVTSGTVEFTVGTLTNNGTINGTETKDQNGNIFITPKAGSSAEHAAQNDAFDFGSQVLHQVAPFEYLAFATLEQAFSHSGTGAFEGWHGIEAIAVYDIAAADAHLQLPAYLQMLTHSGDVFS